MSFFDVDYILCSRVVLTIYICVGVGIATLNHINIHRMRYFLQTTDIDKDTMSLIYWHI